MITALSEPVPLTDGQLRSVALSMGIGEFATVLAMRPRHAIVDRHGGAAQCTSRDLKSRDLIPVQGLKRSLRIWRCARPASAAAVSPWAASMAVLTSWPAARGLDGAIDPEHIGLAVAAARDSPQAQCAEPAKPVVLQDDVGSVAARSPVDHGAFGCVVADFDTHLRNPLDVML